jgi:hypothetical protein
MAKKRLRAKGMIGEENGVAWIELPQLKGG